MSSRLKRILVHFSLALLHLALSASSVYFELRLGQLPTLDPPPGYEAKLELTATLVTLALLGAIGVLFVRFSGKYRALRLYPTLWAAVNLLGIGFSLVCSILPLGATRDLRHVFFALGASPLPPVCILASRLGSTALARPLTAAITLAAAISGELYIRHKSRRSAEK